jgi:hypothetical protein
MTSRVSLCLSCVVVFSIVGATHARAQGPGVPVAPRVQVEPVLVELAIALEQVRGGRSGGPAPTQAAAQLPSDPLTGPDVTNAPYAGDSVTLVTQTLGDGTRIEQRTEARFYRDSAGRIRREQTILGLGALNPGTDGQTVVTVDPTPGDSFAYTLDPINRTARRVSRAGGSGGFATTVSLSAVGGIGAGGNVDLQRELERASNLTRQGVGKQESLGTRQMEGVKVVGRKTTNIIPAGQIGNDRAIEITDERWESPELKILIYSRFSDPRTGVVEFRLTNINRAEPQADLFTIPSEYTVIEPGGRGLRTGGPAPGTTSGQGRGQ